MNRVTVRTGCFDFVTDLDIPGLQSVSHFNILSAISGILIALTLNGSQESRETAINALIGDASFVPNSLLFLIGKAVPSEPAETVSTSSSSSSLTGTVTSSTLHSGEQRGDSHTGSQTVTPSTQTASQGAQNGSQGSHSTSSAHKKFEMREHTDVTPDEYTALQKMVALLLSRHTELNKEEILDDDICTICYANRKTAAFFPCGHHSCRYFTYLYYAVIAAKQNF